MFFPEGSFTPLGFIIVFILAYCLFRLGQGIFAGITGKSDIYRRKINWLGLFIILFVLYLLINWQDIAANAWRGYVAGAKTDLERNKALLKELSK